MKATFVAAIHGPALGGGLELALACHYRVCTDSPSTQVGLPEVQLGLLPGSGGTQRLPRLIGVQQAMKMMLTGSPTRAKQAKKYGIVDDVVPHSVLLKVAEQFALKRKPEREAPQKSVMDKMLEKTGPGRNMMFKKSARSDLCKNERQLPCTWPYHRCYRNWYQRRYESGP